MATGETGFDDDVTFGLISFQYHSLKAGHDYGQYVRDAENAGLKDITQFFRQTTDEDPARAARCHELIRQVGGSDQGGTGNALNSARQSPGFLRCEAARACSRRDDGPGHARLRPDTHELLPLPRYGPPAAPPGTVRERAPEAAAWRGARRRHAGC